MLNNQVTEEKKEKSKFKQGCLITVGIFLLIVFGFIIGAIATTGYISIINNISPIDLLKPEQLGQEYFYREKETEEELPEEFEEMETVWISDWVYEFDSGYWSEGEHQIKVKWIFPDWYDFEKIPEKEEIDREIKEQLQTTSPPTYETKINFKVDYEAKKHENGVIIDISGLYTAGKEIEDNIINPNDETILYIGWVTDYEMKYEEAKRFYDACIVEINIDDDVSIKIEHRQVRPHKTTKGIFNI
jgi:hypothetical protein